MTASPDTQPLGRERTAILVLLLVLAAGSWVLLIQQSTTSAHGAGITMGMGPIVFLAVWVAMMIAMMFPTAAPMIVTFAKVSAGRRERGSAFVPTWVFVGGYLLVWLVFGAMAYPLALAAESVAASSLAIAENAGRIGGIAILLAGLYQLSPLKRVCLTNCRSPMEFVMTRWREGYSGALRMGVEHGAYCLGCCWLLFVILFPIGMMNVAAMALITVLIYVEKSLAYGRRVAQLAAAALVLYGALVVVQPQLLPTAMDGMPMDGMEQPATPAEPPKPADKDAPKMKM